MNFLGPHGWNIRAVAETAQFARNERFISGVFYGVVAWFCKLSIFLLYLRVFSPFDFNRWTCYLVYFGIVVSFMVYFSTSLAFALAYAFHCTPRGRETWQEALQRQSCTAASYAPGNILGPFNVFFDIYLFLLPLRPIWKLQMDRKKKTAVSVIFATGIFAIVASVMGLYYRVLAFASRPDTDVVWVEPVNLLVAVIELTVTVMCGSMPCLAPFFRLLSSRMSKLVASSRFFVFRFKNYFCRNHTLPPTENHEFISVKPFKGLIDITNHSRQETKIFGTMKE